MPSFEVSFDVYCGRCGAGLCQQSETLEKRGVLQVHVEPCEHCMKNTADESHDAAHDEDEAGFEELRRRVAELESEAKP